MPISISSDVVPEMQEYERTETTVVNSYVRPEVSNYITNLQASLEERMGENLQLSILRSDGGLASSRAAAESPVNLLLSGPAGGVTGAIYFASRAGYDNVLTFDMGGTSTDVALIQNAQARIRRETRVGDVTVRAPSVDVRTVGAGGGSIAFVPQLTKALRVGPESAGAEPGPAAYMKGGDEPTVCDANVVLGYLPSDVQLGGKMAIDKAAAETAVQKVADAHGHQPDGGGRRHHQDRQRVDVWRPAAGFGRAGLRPARFRAGGLRRRRPAARQRDGHPDRFLAGDRAAGPGRAVCLR